MILAGFSENKGFICLILGKYDILYTLISMYWMCIIVLYDRTPYNDRCRFVLPLFGEKAVVGR